MLNRANMSTLNNRRLQDIAVMMCIVKNNLSPEYISELFSKSNNHYDLRNADFNIPKYNTVKYGKHSLRYYGLSIYICSKPNKQDRENPNLQLFRRNIRKTDLESLLENNCRDCVICSI